MIKPSRFVPQSKPAKDMTGWAGAGCHVLRKAPTVSKSARFYVKIDACGHETYAEGVVLRQYDKNGKLVRCPTCRPFRKDMS